MRVALLCLLGCRLWAEGVTYSGQAARILIDHCVECHRPGEAAPFSLLSYADAKRHARQIAAVTEQRYMPPWPPEPGHGEFAGVRRLTREQIQTLRAWADAGAPAGDLSQAPRPPAFPTGWQLGTPDLVLRMRQPYALAAAGEDVFRNFVLPVELRERKYVRAMELRPGDKRLVHHANLIVDRGRTLRRRDGQDGAPGFPGMDVETEVSGEFDPDSHFLFWKPGTPAQQEPADMAWRLDPGADLIVNLHLQPSGKPESVAVEVGLYFADSPPSRFPMLVQLEHDGALDIPAGSDTFQVTDELRLPLAVTVLAVYPHAHYLGKQIHAWAELPDRTRRELILIEDWDINWQATYTYRQPVELPPGTVLRMRIRYDNSEGNPRNPHRPPLRVHAGNRSSDEMGHLWLQVIPRGSGSDDPRVVLQEAVMRRRIEKYPEDFTARFNLGAALQAREQFPEALAALSKAAAIRPDSAAVHNNLGVCYFVLERRDEAEREFRLALRLDPAYQNARFNLGKALMTKPAAEEALAQFATYLEANPDDTQAHENFARIAASLGRLDAALPHFRRAVELSPGDAALHINLGAVLTMRGELEQAIAEFETALRLDPGNPAALEKLARARAARQQP